MGCQPYHAILRQLHRVMRISMVSGRFTYQPVFLQGEHSNGPSVNDVQRHVARRAHHTSCGFNLHCPIDVHGRPSPLLRSMLATVHLINRGGCVSSHQGEFFTLFRFLRHQRGSAIHFTSHRWFPGVDPAFNLRKYLARGVPTADRLPMRLAIRVIAIYRRSSDQQQRHLLRLLNRGSRQR